MSDVLIVGLPGLFGVILAIIAVWRIQVEARISQRAIERVHVLVNSNMTSVLESEVSAIRRELVLLKELTNMRQAAGHEPSAESMAEIAATEAKIAELDTNLRERAGQAELASKI